MQDQGADNRLSGPTARILLVDDEPANLLALEALLGGLGQELVKANSGEEALRQLLTREFAVVLLDVRMQGLSGFDTAQLIRARPKLRSTPIIFLTAYEDSDVAVCQAYGLGAVDYLVKPLVPAILRAKVATFVDLFQKTEQVRKLERQAFERQLAVETLRRFQSIIEHSWEGVALIDREGIIRYASPSTARILGYTTEECVGQSIVERIHPEDLQRATERFHALGQRPGGNTTSRYRYHHQNGSWRWLESTGTNLLEEPGVKAIVVNYRDITEEREAEETRARLAALVESSDDAIIGRNLEGLITSWNAGAERLYGYTAAEVIGQPVSRLIPPSRANELPAIRARLERGETIDHFETVRLRKNGTQVEVSATLSPIRDPDGRVVGASVIARDISERRRVEADRAALLAQEQAARVEAEAAARRARFLAEASALLASSLEYEVTLKRVAELAVPAIADWCSVDLLTQDGSLRQLAVTRVDPAKIELSHEPCRRYPRDRTAPSGIAKVLRTKQADLYPEISAAFLEEYVPDPEHRRLLQELGLRSALVVPLVAREQVLGTLTLLVAESGRRYGPSDLAFTEDLACRAAVAIDNARLYQEVREADRHKDRFLAMLAHEMRAPLAPLLMGTQILRQLGAKSGPQEQAVGMVERQVGHLRRLVEDLLQASRLQHGRIELRLERLDLARLVQTVAEDQRSTLEQAGLTLTVETPETPCWVRGDATRLSQVVSNLLDNAQKFTDQGGRVAVRLGAEAARRQAVLSVSDTGIGIEPDRLSHLFRTFAQEDRSLDRRRGGLGLGLAMVHGLVELHGGTVEAHSEGPGCGAEFVVLLPLQDEPAALTKSPPPSTPAGPSRRILIIEDNRDCAQSLQLLLELLGHEVRVAYSGTEGVQAATEWQPNVVISDIGLPGLNGFGVAEALRRDCGTASAFLIALTGYGSDEDHRRALASGFDQHLTKPVDPAVLEDLLVGRGNGFGKGSEGQLSSHVF
jgi:PAS domain S-box-containing protein